MTPRRGFFGQIAAITALGLSPRRDNGAGSNGGTGRPELSGNAQGPPLAMLAGLGLGTVAVQGLHAQAKAPIYTVAEIEVTKVPTYVKDYAPKAEAAIKAAGGRVLAASTNVTSIEGAPPKTRVTIQVLGEYGTNSSSAVKTRNFARVSPSFRASLYSGELRSNSEFAEVSWHVGPTT